MTESQNGKSYLNANLKFWSKFVLEGLGIAAGLALVFLVFQFFRLDTASFGELASLYPFYLFIIGAFTVMLMVSGCFQTMFSVLMSMNVTRKALVTGMLLSEAAMILIINLAAFGIWQLFSSDIAEGGMKILPLMLGAMFAVSSIATVIGAAGLKWGKLGVVLSMGLYVILGAGLGFTFAVTGGNGSLMEVMAGLELEWASAVGVVLFLISGVFVYMSARKMEVRR